MRYLSLFSGIEAATVAWRPLGWEAAAFAEIDKFPSAVLAHHYPEVPNLGDVTKANFDAIGPVDIIVFGSPCQSFSVAGKRLGMADPRGNLALYALSVVSRLRPAWFLFENVPGLLSSGGGRDFGQFLAAVGECGYQCAWRSLDAQYFGLAQRRERVFVVGHLGDWRRAAAVLFDGESLSGNPAPRREAGQRVALPVTSRVDRGGEHREAHGNNLISMALNAHGGSGRMDGESETFVVNGNSTPEVSHGLAFPLRADDGSGNRQCVTHALDSASAGRCTEDGTGRGTPLVVNGNSTPEVGSDLAFPLRADDGSGNRQAIAFSSKDHGADAGDLAPTLRAMGHAGSHANAGGQVAVAFSITPSNSNADFNARANDRSQALTGSGNIPSARGGDVVMVPNVRRLTPRECEALQGFPRNYTLVPYRGKPAADGPRYKALGNSFAVPVLAWIGQRIQMVTANGKGSEVCSALSVDGRRDCAVKGQIRDDATRTAA